MPHPRGPSRYCPCGALLSNTHPHQKKYCSTECQAAGATTSIEIACQQCGALKRYPRSVVAKGKGRFCSAECRQLAQRKFQGPLTRPCEQCGTETDGRRRFCKPACYWESLRKPKPERHCVQCGGPVLSVNMRVRYCSYACSHSARRTGEWKSCPRCDKSFYVPRWLLAAGYGRFCSGECSRLHRMKPRAWPEFLNCELCGDRYSTARRGTKSRPRYCGRDCTDAARRKPRITVECARCGKPFQVADYDLERSLRRGNKNRYHHKRCYRLAVRPATKPCRVCGAQFKYFPWRHQKFCSVACANRRRVIRRSSDRAERIAFIVDLHAAGLKSTQIGAELVRRDPQWLEAPATIRKIVSREKRALAGSAAG